MVQKVHVLYIGKLHSTKHKIRNKFPQLDFLFPTCWRGASCCLKAQLCGMASNNVGESDYRHAEHLPKWNQDPDTSAESLAPLSHYHNAKLQIKDNSSVKIKDP